LLVSLLGRDSVGFCLGGLIFPGLSNINHGRFIAAGRQFFSKWSIRGSLGCHSRWSHVATWRAQWFGQPARASKQLFRPLRHVTLLEMIHELGRLLTLRLAYGLKNAGLGHTAEIVVDRWRPSCRSYVELDSLGDAIGVSQSARTLIPRLMHCVDAQPDAMRKQRVSAVGVECKQRVPQITGVRGQLIGPRPMPIVDGLRNAGVVEAGRLVAEDPALYIDLNAGVGRVAIEELEAESMEGSQERYIRILSKCIAQGERPVRRELGHQPVGDRLQAAVFFWLLSIRWAADLRLRAFDRRGIDSVRVRLRPGLWIGWLVLGSHIAALHTQHARAIDANKRASARNLLRIILDRSIVECGKCRLDLAAGRLLQGVHRHRHGSVRASHTLLARPLPY
jgi:hypothetical protein